MKESKYTFSAYELVELAEYYLERDDLEDAKDPLDVLQEIFKEFKGRDTLARAINTLSECQEELKQLKRSFVPS